MGMGGALRPTLAENVDLAAADKRGRISSEEYPSVQKL